MKTARTLMAAALFTTVIAGAAAAQKTTPMATGRGGSPHVMTEWKVGEANISIAYGRPALKGRDESTMMPDGKPWRTGADAATVLTTDRTLKFGDVTLAPGSYTINTMPGQKEWHLLLGKLEKPGQWGVPYNAALELGRVPMKVGKTKEPAEMVTYFVDSKGATQTLRIEWGTRSVTAPFTVQ